MVHTQLLQNNISWYVFITVILLKDIWAASSLRLLRIRLAIMNIHVQILCEYKFSSFWNKQPVEQLVGWIVITTLVS